MEDLPASRGGARLGLSSVRRHRRTRRAYPTLASCLFARAGAESSFIGDTSWKTCPHRAEVLDSVCLPFGGTEERGAPTRRSRVVCSLAPALRARSSATPHGRPARIARRCSTRFVFRSAAPKNEARLPDARELFVRSRRR